jgi:hypothetical protein
MVYLKSKNKKAIQRDILMAMVLGILVLTIITYFIFYEYFAENDLSLESCRQSIVLRQSAPNTDFLTLSVADFKSKFPLKCKTNVEVIDFENKSKAEKLIAENLARCWYLFGEGRYTLFPIETYSMQSYCVPCTRVHFDEKVIDFYKKTENQIDVLEGLDQRLEDSSITAKEYLKNAFKASNGVNWIVFDVGTESQEFEISGDKFILDDVSTDGDSGFIIEIVTDLKNRFVGGMAKLTLPRYINPDNGDLVIFYDQVTRADKSDKLGHGSFLFYFQYGQTNPNPFVELEQQFLDAGDWSANLCDEFDGVPL